MIEFVHNDIKVKCKPENALKYKQLMDKPPKTRTVLSVGHTLNGTLQ